ncbi:MAG: helix-turn-helix domain-containing protein, partial [Clostridiales Family XIII bacterium]|nr:helix-turn-helix domain-containing protein [Clostridiales Family XIII bacterium]
MLGHILKEARKKQGLTLSALSKQVGVTVGYISNLEHNRLEPSLPVLCDLADKLNIPPSMLLSVNEEERIVVCKKERRPSAVFSNLPSPCEVLTPFAWRSQDEAEISVLHLSVPSGSNLRTDMPALGSDEFVYVMKGKLAYSHGDKSLPLSEGCGAFIPDMTGRTLMNTSGASAEILWIAKSENAEVRKTGTNPKKDPAQEEHDKDSDAPAMLFMGENIRKLRIENGMTVAALADKIGMTSAYVSKVERGLVKPLLPVLRKVSKALDAEMMYLFNVPFPNDIKISKG